MEEINIAIDYSDSPGGRFRSKGPKSGEEFREEFLEKYFNSDHKEKIVINLDGTFGYAPSFLEETFGGLVRKFGYERVSNKFEFISEENPQYTKKIEKYMMEAMNEFKR